MSSSIKKLLKLAPIALVILAYLPTSLFAAETGYKNGFFIKDDNNRFSFKVGGYMQGQALVNFPEGASDTYNVRLRRARLKFGGHVYDESVTYALEYDFTSGTLFTAYLQARLHDHIKFRIGQYKVPFNYEGQTSASTLQFVNRSLIHATFGLPNERELGMGVEIALIKKVLDFHFGVFNGDGFNSANVDDRFRYAARLVYNAFGKVGKAISDIPMSEEPSLTLAMGGFWNEAPDGVGIPVKNGSATVDASFKQNGFSAHAAYFISNIDADNAAALTNHGVLVQTGYFFMPDFLEAAARASLIFFDGGGDRAEYTGGMNIYFFGVGHYGAKLQLDYSVLTTQDGIAIGNDALTHRGRAQLQVKF